MGPSSALCRTCALFPAFIHLALAERDARIKTDDEKQGVLDWQGCAAFGERRITGVKTLCWQANTVAHHCVAAIDLEHNTDIKQREVVFQMGDKLFPATIRNSGESYDLDVHAKSFNRLVVPKDELVSFMNTPNSLLLELSGAGKCKTGDTETEYEVALVHCVPSYEKLEGADIEYARSLSPVGRAYPSEVEVYKAFQQVGEGLSAHDAWKQTDSSTEPPTVNGLKDWSTKYLFKFPEYKATSSNCQQFESGVYRAVAADKDLQDDRKQGTLTDIANYVGFSGFGSSSSSQSSGTTGKEGSSCGCKGPAQQMTGIDTQGQPSKVCVYDYKNGPIDWPKNDPFKILAE